MKPKSIYRSYLNSYCFEIYIVKYVRGMCTMEEYGMLQSVDVGGLQKEFEDMTKYLDDLLQNPEILQEIDQSAKVTRYISIEDLERPFTC